MKISHVRSFKGRLLGVKPFYIGLLALFVSVWFARHNLYLAPAVAVVTYFSWAIMIEDIESYKIGHFNLLGLLAGGVLMGLFGVHFDSSIFRALVFFFIGWGMFQLFEGDIGGGDVRLVTVLAVFLNTVQILSAISLAAAVGMVVGSNLKLKRVPFGALLIVSAWLAFWVVRF